MRNNYVLKSYAKSLLLIALLAVVVVTTRLVVEVFFVDVIHGNPHRSATDTRELILFMMPLISLTVFIGVFVVFAIPQILQGSLACLLEQVFGHKGSWGIFLALPVTACMTWYCYEYFTPTDMAINPDETWRPFQHGLTITRYLSSLGVQAVVTGFTLAYFLTAENPRLRKQLLLYGLVLAMAFGALYGHIDAVHQYKFYD